MTRSANTHALSSALSNGPGAAITLLALSAVGLLGGCTEEVKYKPKPAHSGEKAALPAVPNLPKKPLKEGDTYNVWGLSFSFRSADLMKNVVDQKVDLKGVIGHVNYDDVPACAVHKTGKEDPKDCGKDKPIPQPTFWVCDSAEDKKEDCIAVMGWASNFANVHDAIDQNAKKTTKPEPWMDSASGIAVPNPLPQKGAEVVVTGTYSALFKGISSTAADPLMGILTYKEMKVTKAVDVPVKLPGMK